MMPADTEAQILVVTGGTSDIPVAEEAAVTAETLGNPVKRIYDVGVAGIHRLLSHTEEIMTANVIIAIAGMRPGGLSGHRRSHQRGVRDGVRRRHGAALHAEFLRQRRQCGKYR